MEETCIFCPAMAVPITVKMPEPMTAPMPSAVSDQAQVFFQTVFWLFRIGNQLINGLTREKLIGQVNAPGALESLLNSNRKQRMRASPGGRFTARGACCVLRGRPPSQPLARDARRFVGLVLLPPIAPNLAAIHLREPSTPSSKAGRYKSASSLGK